MTVLSHNLSRRMRETQDSHLLYFFIYEKQMRTPLQAGEQKLSSDPESKYYNERY